MLFYLFLVCKIKVFLENFLDWSFFIKRIESFRLIGIYAKRVFNIEVKSIFVIGVKFIKIFCKRNFIWIKLFGLEF